MPARKTARKAVKRRKETARKKAGRAPASAGKAAKRAARSPRKPARQSAGTSRKSGRISGKASGLLASDLMERDVHTVRPDTPVADVSALFKLHNIKGAPVVSREGDLVGIITEDDLVFGQMGISDEEREILSGSGPGSREKISVVRRVAEIMTQNPIAAEESTPVEDLCHVMSRLKIHRVPIVRGQKVVGIVSTIDICRILADGRARLVRA